MPRWLMRDWGAKLGALLLAAALWFHAATEHSFRRELNVPLVIEDPIVPAGEPAIVPSSPVPATVRVAVSGGGKDLLRTSGDDFLLRLRVPVAAAGSRLSLRLGPTQVENHTELELSVEEVIAPAELTVIVDHSQERRVPVRPRIGLHLAESYTQVGRATLDPDSVDVSGPVSHLRELDAVYTDSLHREAVREDIDLELALHIPEGRQLKMGRDRVRVLINIQELAEYSILNVPVSVTGGPQDAVAEPSRVTVRVRGGADLIGALDPESDLRLTVQYAAAITDEGGLIAARQDRLYEIRQILPARATVGSR
ncbi:MAG: hypothetical protein CME04_24730 [Gemmatimonadaceae bacterium]|jgi:hypothetical protein|nr:hypothetical protein [Gemmatimonadaceae bacterium]